MKFNQINIAYEILSAQLIHRLSNLIKTFHKSISILCLYSIFIKSYTHETCIRSYSSESRKFPSNCIHQEILYSSIDSFSSHFIAFLANLRMRLVLISILQNLKNFYKILSIKKSYTFFIRSFSLEYIKTAIHKKRVIIFIL